MAMSKELERLLAGKTDPMEIAQIVSNYTKRAAKKHALGMDRAGWMHQLNKGVRKLTKAQMDAAVWEYAIDCNIDFEEWLRKQHPEFFRAVVKKTAES